VVILGCVQPSYLAWIPFFKRMQMSDVFVYLDDVEYSKNSFHNRNRIKTPQGSLLLTVPVLYRQHSKTYVKDMPINNNIQWASKHWRSIEQNYSKAKFFNQLGPLLYDNIYGKQWERLGELNIALIEIFKEFLGLSVRCHRSSDLVVAGQANDKLVNMCKKLGADKFIVKPNTENYHPKNVFEKHGIDFEYFVFNPTKYEQLYGNFIPNLSILDYVMNLGPNSF
jgi:hypothetical protein